MLGHTFFHDLMRKYVSTFGTLFNDIKVRRTNRLNEVIETLEVPLTYGPKEKFVARLQSDPDLERQTAFTLPRMSFEIIQIGYDQSRQLPPTNKIFNTSDPSPSKRTFAYVPYDIRFALNIYTATNEDGVRIVEQILPFFVPQFTPTVKLLDDPDITMDLPIVFGGVTTQDIYDGSFDQRRVLVHSLDFMMKAYMIGPVTETNLILSANTNFFIDQPADALGTSNTDVTSIKLRPGQFANGSPTSNGELTVAANTIAPNSTFGFITTVSTTTTANDEIITT